jgi:hypothetical protein
MAGRLGFEIMSADVRHDAEDQEPELRVAGKAPAKKPLAEFLAEFEERLANHPDEAATGALRVVEERAAGLRRSPAETSPTQYAPTETEAPALEAAPKPAPEDTPGSEGVTGETGADTTQAERSGESRRLRGRRRRKHRHPAH